MASWDRRAPAAYAKAREAAVRRQLSELVGPYSPYWREQIRERRRGRSPLEGMALLETLPAVGERDVCPDGDPAGAAGLVLQADETGFALSADGPVLRRALLRRVAARDSYRRIVETDTRPTSFAFAGLAFRFPVASTRADLDLVARAGARLWQVLGLTSADLLVAASPAAATVEHQALSYAALAAGSRLSSPGRPPRTSPRHCGWFPQRCSRSSRPERPGW